MFCCPLSKFSPVLAVSRPYSTLTRHDGPGASETGRHRARLRDAQKIWAKRVKIGPDGSIDILLGDDDMAQALACDQQEPGPIRIRRHAKKRMEF
jgi:hypothetical protein